MKKDEEKNPKKILRILLDIILILILLILILGISILIYNKQNWIDRKDELWEF